MLNSLATQMMDHIHRPSPLITLSAFLLSGCLFPPELTNEDESPLATYPPVIFSSAEPFLFPGPILINRQESRTLSVTVLDNDVEDTIYMKLYVDYSLGNPLPALATCNAPATQTQTRILTTCSLSAICNAVAPGDTDNHILEALVSDSPFIFDDNPRAEGQPAFRAIEDPERSIPVLRSWEFRCVETN